MLLLSWSTWVYSQSVMLKQSMVLHVPVVGETDGGGNRDTQYLFISDLG